MGKVPREIDIDTVEKPNGEVWSTKEIPCDNCGVSRKCYIIQPQDYKDTYGFLCKKCAISAGFLEDAK